MTGQRLDAWEERRAMGPVVECERCHGPLGGDVKLLPDGTLLCASCAAQAAVHDAASRPRPKPSPAWMRPELFRRHGTIVSVLLGLSGLLGVPFALYGLVFVPAVTLWRVVFAYVLLFGVSSWAGLVRSSEPRTPPPHAISTGANAPENPTVVPSPAARPSSGLGNAAAAAAGPAMIAGGFGVLMLVVLAFCALALALAAYFLWIFLRPVNVG
jgi:hypothetical protein